MIAYLENRLRKASSHQDPLLARFQVLCSHLEPLYSFWAQGFPGGNDHGWGHIERVLGRLNDILEGAPRNVVSDYDVFLAMVAIVFHDWGILRARKDHPQIGAKLILAEAKYDELSEVERDVVAAAVASHGSKTEIGKRCAALGAEITLGKHRIHPTIIAALVRLSDELDEDSRRAPDRARWAANLPEESRFYWRFSQCITGIQTFTKSRLIQVDVRFRPEDLAAQYSVDGRPRVFLSAFADKVEKLNREREYTAEFLPTKLRFRHINLQVALSGDDGAVKSTRSFTFSDNTTAKEFLASLPHLWAPTQNQTMVAALRQALSRDYQTARETLGKLERVMDDLPSGMQLRVLYDQACFASRQAAAADFTSAAMALEDEAFAYLRKWFELGVSSAWDENGMLLENEVYRMARDNDLDRLVFDARPKLQEVLPSDVHWALPSVWEKRSYGSGGGCIARGTLIETPRGFIGVESLREGDACVTFSRTQVARSTGVIERILTHRAPSAIVVNGRLAVSPMQLVLVPSGAWVAANELRCGDRVTLADGGTLEIASLDRTDGRFELFDIVLDSEPHSYGANGIVCHNKKTVG